MTRLVLMLVCLVAGSLPLAARGSSPGSLAAPSSVDFGGVVLGSTALFVGLLLALAADHASMAVLVWVMALAGAALAVAFALAWRPRWLRWLAPWIGVAVRTPAASAASSRRRSSGPA